MASFSACQCSFTLTLLILIAASPIQTHARESNFFSKVTRSEPQTLKPVNVEPKPDTLTPETEKALPEAETKTKTEQGYGLFGKEEAYEYAPTTTNPTKSEPGNFKYVQPNGVKEGNRVYSYEAAEKQGMSDTRFLENGKYFYDLDSEKEAVANNGKLEEKEDDGHESYYGQGYESGNQYRDSRYETEEKQGMSDTRSFQNGKYFDDLEAEKRNRDRYPNNVEFYGSGKYGNQFQKPGEKQGMSDTRFLENGKYFYDIQGESKEDGNGAESYQGESYDSNYEEEDEVDSEGYKGTATRRNDFRGTPNKFPKYEFDSMEEYEKYEEGRSHQKEYVP